MNTLLTSGLQNFADRIKNDPHWSQYFEADHALLMEAIAELKTKSPAPPAAPVVPEGWKLVPTALTAENGAKAALMGEFSMRQVYQCPCFPEGGTSTCMVCKGAGWMTLQMPVDWSTIKAIWAAGIAHFAAHAEPSGNPGELPAGEQAGLTDAEILTARMDWAMENYPQTLSVDQWKVGASRAVIAAHEAKRASCSQTAKTSTREAGRVDETEKSEHVGGAA